MDAIPHFVWFRHDVLILALSLTVSLGASATALSLMIYASGLRRSGEVLLLFGGACGGAGGWATSFITLLSFEPGYAIGFDAHRVGASLALPVIAGALGILAVLKIRRPWNVPAWGLIFALGVGLMDYMSLTALQVGGRLAISPVAMIAALVCGPSLAMIAMRLAVRARRWGRFTVASAAMGLALFSMQAVMEIGLQRLPDARLYAVASLASRGALAADVAGLTALLAFVALVCIGLQARTDRRSHDRLRSIFDAMPHPVAYYDRDDRFVLGNSAYLNQFAALGVSVGVGRRFSELLEETVGHDRPDWPQDRRSAWVEERTLGLHQVSHQIEQSLSDGRCLLSQSSRTADGGVVTVLSDVTDYKRQAKDLVAARDLAEAATRAKSEFLANMSHEIRTPLNGVLGMAQAMATEALPAVQRHRLDVIRQAGEALLCVLNDVLDISKVEAGKLEIEAHVFDVVDLTGAVHGALSALAAQKALHFSWKVEDAAAGAYLGDAVRLRQILLNLGSNALKFTEQGSVALHVEAGADGLVFTVTDTGIGMTPDQLGRLFQKFSQADASTTRRFGGTGLGLAISRDLAALMGGTIEVESTMGRGSVFRLSMPLKRETAAPARAAPARATPDPSETSEAGLKVLAAEDNAVNQLVLRTLLSQIGADLVIVDNGVEALQAWMKEDWDVILMDVQMPQMDGPSATREIRAREALQKRRRTPVIALTANAMSHQVAAYVEAGMDAFVAKPIAIADLFAALDAVTSGKTEALAAA